ncbi:MAG: lipoprotein signal peptidase [Muribaculaceae bacterium]|nr:lipoprotein signal peptidase [Muribaculaceae bacterium]MDE6703925.1 lipoprotein signal peptidase [Muribaculaceae bacterium]
MKNSKAWLAVCIIFVVIVIDQLIKIWVKTNMYWGEDIEIFSWFHIRFVQNNGMAFGMELGSKLFLTLFRLVAVGVLCWIISRLCRNKAYPKGFIACVALITAGAAGNIFDCVFYGEIFSNPYPPQIATFVPWGEGYAPLFHGLVVDMFYFPLFSFQWPEWMPFVAGKTFSFFDPVFNFADSAITVGMAILIICYSRFLGGKHVQENSVE